MSKPLSSPTYVCDVIVIHKTKLSESDLILDLLNKDGEVIRAVAKSARKPGNTFSNRLDLFNVAHVCIARTKNLHIIREAKLLKNFASLRTDYKQLSCASLVCELLWRLSFHGEVSHVMFDFVSKTLDFIDTYPDYSREIAITSAFKLMSIEGFKPQLAQCSHCGKKVLSASNYVDFSCREGGIVCSDCAMQANTFDVSVKGINTLMWLISSTYEDVLEDIERARGSIFELSKVLKWWVRYYVGHDLKSLQLSVH